MEKAVEAQPGAMTTLVQSAPVKEIRRIIRVTDAGRAAIVAEEKAK